MVIKKKVMKMKTTEEIIEIFKGQIDGQNRIIKELCEKVDNLNKEIRALKTENAIKLFEQ